MSQEEIHAEYQTCPKLKLFLHRQCPKRRFKKMLLIDNVMLLVNKNRIKFM